MKNLIILFCLIVSASATNAQQASASNESWGANAGPSRKEEPAARIVNTNAYSIDAMTIDVAGDVLTMDNIPNLNSLTLHITDANGQERITKKISARNSKIDIARLPKGMFFATITSENNDNRKSFTFSRD